MDKATEQGVWQRVYGNPPPPRPMTTQQRQNIQRCIQRCQSNLRFYESQRQHPVYREAYAHLALQTTEHIKMLQQILSSSSRR